MDCLDWDDLTAEEICMAYCRHQETLECHRYSEWRLSQVPQVLVSLKIREVQWFVLDPLWSRVGTSPKPQVLSRT